VPQRVPHAEGVEAGVAEGQRLSAGLDQGRGDRPARLLQHAAAGIEPDHAGAAGERCRLPRDEAGAGGHVQEGHARLHAEAL